MRFIVSPAKKMNVVDDSLPSRSAPRFLNRTLQLAESICALTYEDAKELWQCSDALAQLNFERFHAMDFQSGALTPAILSYEGIQYQHMAPHVMRDDQLEYVQTHLRILSGFYGILRPFDGVVPYRLEMQAKLGVCGHRNLYDFWGSSLYDALADESDLIVNLASVEYAKAVLPHARQAARAVPLPREIAPSLQDGQALVDPPSQVKLKGSVHASKPRILTCLFGTLNSKGCLVQRSTAAKAARGSMVRWCAENNIHAPHELKEFDIAGYCYDRNLSSQDCLVFVK